MIKRLCLAILGWIFFLSAAGQNLKTPAQFLGYTIGTRFTPHYRLVEYFNHVAANAPAQVKLMQYGSTNEGRPLLLAMVGSPENLARLEEIKLNNQRLAGATPGNASLSNPPAICWLSYNVHGNEASSSEAALLTLYELVNSNSRTQAWLQNTLIIIDPCLNPDGRDRYVHWFNSVVGKEPNANPESREHSEPWPGGRVNHYYFDLNRDWAWQTQVESRQRIQQYNQWLPQVHVDFHEQGYNNPYYFAPAAEPYHEAISPWQREFQNIIGRNNAKYFDANGWLYFTKEVFDLFYPSYGDTYPTFNGSIGMTYEQAGHSRGGLAIENKDGDTLRLTDRALHHFTTSLATIEMTSQHAKRALQEFKAFFDRARNNPQGEFKSYVLKAENTDKLQRLTRLLGNNNIRFDYARAGAALSGLNYFTGKTENFQTEKGDVVINANQTGGHMLRILFERQSKISDSATYDITSWSLPFVYGVKTYGLGNFYTGATETAVAENPANPATEAQPYAWLVRWNGMKSARFLSAVLKKGVKVRFAESAFSVGGSTYDRGTLIITKTGNTRTSDIVATVTAAANGAGVQLDKATTGFVDKGFDFGSDKVRNLNAPRVALVSGDGTNPNAMGEVWHFMENELNYPVSLILLEDLPRVNWRNYDVLILPDGRYPMLSDKNAGEALRTWIQGGGRLIAIDRAVSQLARGDWGLKLKTQEEKKDEDKKVDYSLLHRYEDRERDFISTNTPGAIYKVELDNSHPLAFGYPDTYYTLKQDDNIYEFLQGGWNVGVIKKDSYLSGFVGSRVKDKLKDGLVLGSINYGGGAITFFAEDPIFRNFWENGKLMLANAIFMVGQ